MTNDNFHHILEGSTDYRIATAIRCLEAYLIDVYPSLNQKQISALLWRFLNQDYETADQWIDRLLVFDPDCLFDRENESGLLEDLPNDYGKGFLSMLQKAISKNDSDLPNILQGIRDLHHGWFVGRSAKDEACVRLVFQNIERILNRHGVPFPNLLDDKTLFAGLSSPISDWQRFSLCFCLPL